MNELREKVLSALNEKSIALFRSVEDALGGPIDFKPSVAVLTPRVPIAALALNIAEPRKSYIMLRDLETIDPASVVHELLHMKRYFIERIPYFYPTRGDLDVHHISNFLEHSVVIPEETTYGYERTEYWSLDTIEMIKRAPHKFKENRDMRHTLIWAILCEFVPSALSAAKEGCTRSLWSKSSTIAKTAVRNYRHDPLLAAARIFAAINIADSEFTTWRFAPD